VWLPVILYLTRAPGSWIYVELSYGVLGAAILLVLVTIKSKRAARSRSPTRPKNTRPPPPKAFLPA